MADSAGPDLEYGNRSDSLQGKEGARTSRATETPSELLYLQNVGTFGDGSLGCSVLLLAYHLWSCVPHRSLIVCKCR